MKIINKAYNLKGNINTNIVLISDIHYFNKNIIKHLNKISDNIKNLKPDYICIPGDLMDKSIIKDENYLIDWLKQLSNISKIIISIGNHEFYINKRKEIYGLNKELYNKIKRINNVYVLDNDNIVLDDINFMGITLSAEYYYESEFKNIDLSKNIEKIKNYTDKYNILLSHSPIGMCNKDFFKNNNIDLVLCGHMHGGMVPNKFRIHIKNRGFISPKGRIFPKIAYGQVAIDNSNIIITSGITIIPHSSNLSIFNKLFNSEIVNIKIKKVNK